MKLNLSLTALQVDRAREPEIGSDSQVFFAPENELLIGTIEATAAAVGAYTSAGGQGIPVAGRDLHLRALRPIAGSGGAMTVTLNVTLDDDTSDTAVATFHLPTYTAAGSANFFPQGTAADFVPAGAGNSAKKIKAIVGLASVANMVAGNQFEVVSTPNLADFVFIDCTTSKAGQFNYPGIIEIPCGTNPSAYTREGRGESNQLSVGFRDRGVLEQLNRFAGVKGTCRIDVVKGSNILSARIVYGGWIPRPVAPRGDGNDIVEATAAGPYERWSVGYARVS